MDDTPLLSLPLLAHKQALQTTFHDDGMKTLDALVMLSVIDRDLSSPPASPDEGDRYIVKAPGSGDAAWVDDNVVAFIDGHWRRHEPRPGWTCYVQDESALIAWDGAAWQPALDVLGGGAAQNLALLGIATTADAANPFSARFNNARWAARTAAEGGDGNLRFKMSKEGAANTLSLLLQDNSSGRAEIGLTGDDDLHLKTSADGSAWVDALAIDRATGGVRFLAHETSVASAATCDIGAAAGLKVSVTGTTAITSFGTQPHRLKFVRFAGALTLTHNATSLILLGGASRTTVAGDCGIYASDGSGNWRELQYSAAGTWFSAYNSATDNNVTGDATNVTVDYDAELSDSRGSFGGNTFTALETGPHSFGGVVTVTGITDHNVMIVRLVTSNRTYQVANLNPANIGAGGTAVVPWGVPVADMDTGDTATVTVLVQGGTGGKVVDVYGDSASTLYTYFMGRKI